MGLSSTSVAKQIFQYQLGFLWQHQKMDNSFGTLANNQDMWDNFGNISINILNHTFFPNNFRFMKYKLRKCCLRAYAAFEGR